MLMTVFNTIVLLSAASSFTIILLYIIRGIMKNKLPHRLALWLWIPIILQLVNPFVPQISVLKLPTAVNQVVGFMDTILPYNHQNDNIDKKPVSEGFLDLHDDVSNNDLNKTTENLYNTTAVGKTNTDTILNKLIAALPWVWLIVVLLLLTRLLVGYLLFMSSIKQDSVELTDYQTILLFNELRNKLRIHKRVGLYSLKKIRTPMLIGLWRPRVLLPAEQYSQDELNFILTHELSHCKNNDLAFKWAGEIVRCIHWFNPLVYFVADSIGRDSELCCDERVVSITGNKTEYGNTLIRMAGKSNRSALPANTMWESRKNMRKRIINLTCINKLPRFKKINSVIYITLLTGLIILGMAACKGAVGSDRTLSSMPDSNSKVTIASNTDVASGMTKDGSQKPSESTANSNTSDKNKSVAIDNSMAREITSEKEKLSYYDKYFGPIDVPTSILGKSWDNPEKVDAQQIFIFFIANSGANGLLLNEKQVESYFDKNQKIYKFPASVYEPIVKKYFKVSTEHLRTAQAYNKSTETYNAKSVTGFGGGRDFKVKEVIVTSLTTTVSVDYFDEKNNPTFSITLVVKDHGDSFEYMSCKTTIHSYPPSGFLLGNPLQSVC